MRVEFVGQSTRDATNPQQAPGRLVNLFREPSMGGGFLLRSVPGMALLASLGVTFMRALSYYGTGLLAVAGNGIWSISTGGTVTRLATITDAVEAGLSENTSIATIVANGLYYTWNGTTLTNVVPGAFTSIGSVAYIGNYTLLTEKNGRRFTWSNLADPGTFNALNFATAEITKDPVLRVMVVGDTVLLLKSTGFERWGVTGSAGAAAFSRLTGAMVETGLAEYGLVANFPNGMAMVGADGRVHIWNGAALTPISTPPVESALATYDAVTVFYYELRGHGFICISFRDCPAWCYDIAMGEWHERVQSDGAWLARFAVRIANTWYLGCEDGKIATMTAACTDFGSNLVRKAVSRVLDVGRRFNIANIEAFPRKALDMQVTGGSDPATVTLKTSKDGMIFGAARDRQVGVAGQYETRLTWRNLGQFRRAVVELSTSAAAELPISTELDVTLT